MLPAVRVAKRWRGILLGALLGAAVLWTVVRVRSGTAPVPPATTFQSEEDTLNQLLARAGRPDATQEELDRAAHALLVRERFDDALPLVARSVEFTPQTIETRIHDAVVDGVYTDPVEARHRLERIALEAAGAWEALLFAGAFAARAGDAAGALADLKTYQVRAPATERPAGLDADIASLERQIVAGSSDGGAVRKRGR